MKLTYDSYKAQLLADPAITSTLKAEIESLDNMNIHQVEDTLINAKLLLALSERKYNEMLNELAKE